MTNRTSTSPEVNLTLPDEVTVCLVDDDPLILSLFARVITRSGHNAITATDASGALQILRENEVHLLLSDWRMPEPEEGERLLRAVRNLYPALNICVMSGAMHPDDQALALSLGARMYIQKPFSAETFTGILASLRSGDNPSDDIPDQLRTGTGPQ